jgi:hypothetical protein
MAASGFRQAWEYSITHRYRLSNTSGVPQIASNWRQRYADGTTDWDHITRMGHEGWKLVSAIPVTANASTLSVTCIFRPGGVSVISAPPTLSQLQPEPPAPPRPTEPPSPSGDSDA